MTILEKALITILFVIFPYVGTFGQDAIKIGGGATISSMTTNRYFNLFENNVLSFYPYVGVDWFGHKYFYISSIVGYQCIGGKSPVQTWEDMDWRSNLSKKWDFIHLNTTARVQYPLSAINIYAGAGLYANINVGKTYKYDEYFSTETPFHTEAINFGEIVEVGLTTAKGRIKMDFNVSYQIHNSASVKIGQTKLYGNTWNVSLGVGYVL